MRFADRIQRKHLIVGGALAVIVCGIAFAQVRTVVPLIVFGVLISLAGQTISVAYHAYQCELFPTEVRSRASGIAYSASRAGAIMSGFIIAALLKDFGVPGVFTGITVFMLVVVVVIGAFGPRTNGVRLEAQSLTPGALRVTPDGARQTPPSTACTPRPASRP